MRAGRTREDRGMSELRFEVRAHLSEELMAAWLDGELAGEERARVASHLADCDLCRAEVAAVRALLADEPAEAVPRPPRRGRLLRYLLPVAAAAAAVWLLVVPTARQEEPRLRSGPGAEPGAVPAVVAVAPVGDAVVPDRPTFTWRAAGADAHYTLVLTDAAGAPVWRTSTPDTVVALPPDVPLAAGRTYYWTVDARLADGEAATTGPLGFRTAP